MSSFDAPEDEEARIRFEMPQSYAHDIAGCDRSGGGTILPACRYDPEEDYNNATGKGRKRMTKNDHIYGMWNDDDSDDDDGGGKARKGLGGERAASANYTKPLSFVASGQVIRGDDEDELTKRKKQSADDSDEEGRPSTGFTIGLGYGTKPESEDAEVPLSFGSTKTHARKSSASFVREKKKAPKAAEAAAEVAAEPKDSGAYADKNFGKFEAHTKGVGLKILEKFGFAGRLGHRGQGIVAPIEVKIRAKGRALQDSGEKIRTSLDKPEAPPAEPNAAEPAPARKPNEQAWRKGSKASKRKVVYKTAEEVRAEQAPAAPAPAQTFIDMRGPQAKISSLDSLKSEVDLSAGSSRNCIELQATKHATCSMQPGTGSPCNCIELRGSKGFAAVRFAVAFALHARRWVVAPLCERACAPCRAKSVNSTHVRRCHSRNGCLPLRLCATVTQQCRFIYAAA